MRTYYGKLSKLPKSGSGAGGRKLTKRELWIKQTFGSSSRLCRHLQMSNVAAVTTLTTPVLAGFGPVPQKMRLKCIEKVYIVLRSC